MNGKPYREEQKKDQNIKKFPPVPQLKIGPDDLGGFFQTKSFWNSGLHTDGTVPPTSDCPLQDKFIHVSSQIPLVQLFPKTSQQPSPTSLQYSRSKTFPGAKHVLHSSLSLLAQEGCYGPKQGSVKWVLNSPLPVSFCPGDNGFWCQG